MPHSHKFWFVNNRVGTLIATMALDAKGEAIKMEPGVPQELSIGNYRKIVDALGSVIEPCDAPVSKLQSVHAEAEVTQIKSEAPKKAAGKGKE